MCRFKNQLAEFLDVTTQRGDGCLPFTLSLGLGNGSEETVAGNGVVTPLPGIRLPLQPACDLLIDSVVNAFRKCFGGK